MEGIEIEIRYRRNGMTGREHSTAQHSTAQRRHQLSHVTPSVWWGFVFLFYGVGFTLRPPDIHSALFVSNIGVLNPANLNEI
jgi:hypothetical protein